MVQTVPLIRAAALMPFVHWLDANGREVHPRLAACDLGFLDLQRPNLPLPLSRVLNFMRTQAKIEGADIGCRVVNENSLGDLANLALVALSSATPLEAFVSVSRSISRHSTHEMISVERRPDAIVITDAWALKLDDEILHLIQQYVAALLYQVCRRTGLAPPLVTRIGMVPHPEFGLAHLQPWFGEQLEAARDRALSFQVPLAVARAELPPFGLDKGQKLKLLDGWSRLKQATSLSASLRLAIEAVLPAGAPTTSDLARFAGMTPRTLQRRLAEEGATVSGLIDETRRSVALRDICGTDLPLERIARQLGYANASAFNRSVQRWTGATPTELRRGGRTDVPKQPSRLGL